MNFYGDRTDVAQFASDIILSSSIALQSITIIVLEKSVVSCVFIATDISSEDIVEATAQTYCLQHMDISIDNTPDGWSP